MFALLEWLRVQRQRGIISGVLAFDADEIRNGVDREEQMARPLQATALEKRGLFIVLTGSYHARSRLADIETTRYPPMASLLPRARTFSVRIQGFGGRRRACTENGCGEQDANQTGSLQRKLSLCPPTDGSYDGVYDLGILVTPSPPVKQKAGNPPKP
ncbi:MAG: hypothetical protein KKD64_09780 [Alphaproteobacteria bacterium]|nr:hypothetical protein [Alphaproteobacteria bacterium]MBU0875888.1 hypothetical protein [Alphaproteobacteria bacterium]MBU1769931.1 hypothetical protein [Alphaproteobacteria bacterium]